MSSLFRLVIHHLMRLTLGRNISSSIVPLILPRQGDCCFGLYVIIFFFSVRVLGLGIVLDNIVDPSLARGCSDCLRGSLGHHVLETYG